MRKTDDEMNLLLLLWRMYSRILRDNQKSFFLLAGCSGVVALALSFVARGRVIDEDEHKKRKNH